MNFQTIIINEGNVRTDYFYPFSVLHPVWELRIGATRLFEKYLIQYPNINLNFYSPKRDILESFLIRFELDNKLNLNTNILTLDSNILPNFELFNFLETLEKLSNDKSYLFTFKDVIVGSFLGKDMLKSNINLSVITDYKSNIYDNSEIINISNITRLNYLWDSIYENRNAIDFDSKYFENIQDVKQYINLSIINEENVKIGKNVKILPGVVLDASEGVIIIDHNAIIMANAVIVGPAYIGKNTVIKIGAKIYEDTSIGNNCKVGGEVEASIIQSYSNKQHDGFLGHSFISEWVNLGADTNTSDLKNTYQNIKVLLNNEEIDTEKMFLGLLCGDHTKSAINTQFNTGTVAGVCGILVREGFLPRFIKSFSWGGKSDSPKYKLSKAIETAEIVLKRRNKTLNEIEKRLLSLEFDKTK